MIRLQLVSTVCPARQRICTGRDDDPAVCHLPEKHNPGGLIGIVAEGRYVYALVKMVALLGVSDLVVVETHDALRIPTRGRSHDVGKIVRPGA